MKRNSVNQIVEFLDLTLLASEGQIQRKVFGYNRTHSCYSNKKYSIDTTYFFCIDKSLERIASMLYFELKMLQLLVVALDTCLFYG